MLTTLRMRSGKNSVCRLGIFNIYPVSGSLRAHGLRLPEIYYQPNFSLYKERTVMQNMQLPLHFHFKIFTPSNDFSVVDARGREVAYTRQKIFKLKEAVEIFSDATRRMRLYRIQARYGATACARCGAFPTKYTMPATGYCMKCARKTRSWHFGMRLWARFRLWACLAVIFSIQVLE